MSDKEHSKESNRDKPVVENHEAGSHSDLLMEPTAPESVLDGDRKGLSKEKRSSDLKDSLTTLLTSDPDLLKPMFNAVADTLVTKLLTSQLVDKIVSTWWNVCLYKLQTSQANYRQARQIKPLYYRQARQIKPL